MKLTLTQFRTVWVDMMPVYMGFINGTLDLDGFNAGRKAVLDEHGITSDQFYDGCDDFGQCYA